jgi:hypothetical protein
MRISSSMKHHESLCHVLSLRKVVDIYSIPAHRLFILTHLRESSRSVALIRLNNGTAGNLLIGVRRPDDLASIVVDNRQGSEAVTLAELAAPAGGNGVSAAGDGATVGVGGRASLHDVGAGSGSAGTRVDTEGPGAGGVGVVADTLGVLDGPLGAGSHHGLAFGDGGSEGRRGEEAGCEEDVGELHCD